VIKGSPKYSGMTQRRFLLINAALILLIVGHFYDIVLDTEHWPFSQYPMFRQAQHGRSLTRMELYGVTRESPHQEFPLRQVSSDFGEVRETASLRRISRSNEFMPEERQQMLNDSLLDALAKYEDGRVEGEHDGPVLQGVRLYEATWQLDDPAKSIADPPDQQKLIDEVVQP
jgi:hypothetical protein